MTGYELTREYLVNLAIAVQTITDLEKRFDKLENLLTKGNRNYMNPMFIGAVFSSENVG